jgi:hypothetical protein
MMLFGLLAATNAPPAARFAVIRCALNLLFSVEVLLTS